MRLILFIFGLLLFAPPSHSATNDVQTTFVAVASATEYIFGYDTDDLTTTQPASGEIRGSAGQVDSTGGTLTKICINLDTVGSSTGVKLMVYGPIGSDSDPSGHALVETITVVGVEGANCYDAAGTLSLTASAWYWIGVIFEDASTLMYSGTLSDYDDYRIYSITYGNSPPDPASSTALSVVDTVRGIWGVYEH